MTETFIPSDKWQNVPPFAKLTGREIKYLTLFVGGQNDEEIAAVCGTKPGTVKGALRIALNKVRGLDDIGGTMPDYSNRNVVGQLLIKQGYFEPAPEA